MSSYSGVKFQGEVYGKVNQLIPHDQFHPGLLWGIGHLKSKATPGPLQSVPLSTIWEALVFYCSVLAKGNLFSNVSPPYSKCIVPSPMGAYHYSRYSPSGKPVPLPKKVAFPFASSSVVVPIKHFKSNIYQLIRVHSKYTIYFLQCSPDIWGTLPIKVKFTILIFSWASGSALVWCL